MKMKKDIYFINDEISKDFSNDRKKIKNMSSAKLEYTCDSYTFIEYYSYGKLHNENGPAKTIIDNINGNVLKKCYYINGEFHKEDGPAVINYYNNGNVESEFYFINGKTTDVKYHSKSYDKNNKLIVEKLDKKQLSYNNGKLENIIENFEFPVKYNKISYYENEKLTFIKFLARSKQIEINKNKSMYFDILNDLKHYEIHTIEYIKLINIALKDMLKLNALTEKEYKELQDLSISALTIKSLN